MIKNIIIVSNILKYLEILEMYRMLEKKNDSNSSQIPENTTKTHTKGLQKIMGKISVLTITML